MVKQQYMYTCDYCGNQATGNHTNLPFGAEPLVPEIPKDWRWFHDTIAFNLMCDIHKVTIT